MLDDAHHYESLALAVVERAVNDLSLPSDRYAEIFRRDAFYFLTTRLWQEGCLWYDLLGHKLVKRQVLAMVHARVRKEPDGTIVMRNPA